MAMHHGIWRLLGAVVLSGTMASLSACHDHNNDSGDSTGGTSGGSTGMSSGGTTGGTSGGATGGTSGGSTSGGSTSGGSTSGGTTSGSTGGLTGGTSGGSTGSSGGGTSGGTTGGTVACSDQFNPELVTSQGCAPVYNQYCPDSASASSSSTSVVACTGVTVTSGTAATATLSTDYVLIYPTGATNIDTLYIGLHDIGESGVSAANHFRFSNLAKGRNIAVVAPTAPNAAGNWGDSLIDLKNTPTNRIALIDALIAQLQTSGVGTPSSTPAFSKIIIAGASSGAQLALEYTCARPTAIDGMLLVAAPITSGQITACPSGIHVATVQIHGTADNIAPYNGKGLGAAAGAPTVFADLYGDNGCVATDILTALMADPNPAVTGINLEWVQPCSGRGSALVTIGNGGHQWPGYTGPIASPVPVNGNGVVSIGFDATIQGYDFLTYLGAGS